MRSREPSLALSLCSVQRGRPPIGKEGSGFLESCAGRDAFPAAERWMSPPATWICFRLWCAWAEPRYLLTGEASTANPSGCHSAFEGELQCRLCSRKRGSGFYLLRGLDWKVLSTFAKTDRTVAPYRKSSSLAISQEMWNDTQHCAITSRQVQMKFHTNDADSPILSSLHQGWTWAVLTQPRMYFWKRPRKDECTNCFDMTSVFWG